jgi:hypothetical protein
MEPDGTPRDGAPSHGAPLFKPNLAQGTITAPCGDPSARGRCSAGARSIGERAFMPIWAAPS